MGEIGGKNRLKEGYVGGIGEEYVGGGISGMYGSCERQRGRRIWAFVEYDTPWQGASFRSQ